MREGRAEQGEEEDGWGWMGGVVTQDQGLGGRQAAATLTRASLSRSWLRLLSSSASRVVLTAWFRASRRSMRPASCWASWSRMCAANDWFSSQKFVSCPCTRAITGQQQSRKVLTLITGPLRDLWSLSSAHFVHPLKQARYCCLTLTSAPGLPGLVAEQLCLPGFGPTYASGLLPAQPLPLPVGPPGHESACPEVTAPPQRVPGAAAHQTALTLLETLGPCEMPALHKGDCQGLGLASTYTLPSLRAAQGIAATSTQPSSSLEPPRTSKVNTPPRPLS